MADFELLTGKGGKALADDVKVMQVTCEMAVNQVPKLMVTLVDGDIHKKEFPLTDGETFQCGQMLQLKAGAGDKKQLIFKGTIYERDLAYHENCHLTLVAYGEAIKLTDGPESFLLDLNDKTTDKELITAVVKRRGLKITCAKSEITQIQYPYYDQTPWRVMMNRVLANGFLFVNGAEKLEAVNLKDHKGKKIDVKLGMEGLKSFSFIQDDRSQVSTITGQFWDVSKQTPTAGKDTKLGLVKESYPTTKVKPHLKSLMSVNHVAKNKKEQNQYNHAAMFYRELDRFQGKMVFTPSEENKIGTAALLDKLKLSDFGKAHSAHYLITGIEHQFTNMGWIVSLKLGLHLNETLMSPYYRLPAMPMMIGKVLKKAMGKPDAEDKDWLQMPVKLPLLSSKKSLWARLAQPHASKGEGMYFPPKPDDEVIVGFLEGDGRYPYILGSLYSKVNTIPEGFSAKEDARVMGISVGQELLSMKLDATKGKENFLIKGKGEEKESELILENDKGLKLSFDKGVVEINKKMLSIKYDESMQEVAENIDINTKAMKVTVSDKMGIE